MTRLNRFADIAGLRVIVQFVDGVNEVVSILRKKTGHEVVQERDYITRQRHQLSFLPCDCEYTVDTIYGAKVFSLVQIRTLAT